MRAFRRLSFFWPLVLLAAALLALPAAAQAGEGVFGIESFESALGESSRAPDTQAGSHPYAFTVSFAFDHRVIKEAVANEYGEVMPTEVEFHSTPKNIETNLPRGVIADPAATPTRCTEAQLESEGRCPLSSAVGRMVAFVAGWPYRSAAPIFNMVAPTGVPGQFAANIAGLGIVVHIDGRVRTGGDYGLSATVSDILDLPDLQHRSEPVGQPV